MEELPAGLKVLQLATSSWVSAAVSAAASLGVADALAAGPRTIEEIAAVVEAHPPTLYRLLRACADLDLFDEHDGHVFTLTELGEALRSDVPGSMRGFASWVGLPAERYTWAHLVTAVRTGRCVFEDVHGENVWDHLRQRPEVENIFASAMTETSGQIIPAVVSTYDFREFTTIVDVGGGHGALLAAVLGQATEAQGILFDQPDVIAAAGMPLKEARVEDRCQLVAGSFFDSVPAGADAYLLSNIIHDWDDEKSVEILRNCRDAMAEGGRVLLVESVMPSEVEPAPIVKLMDLNMLILCGGAQRTEEEFADLFAMAGLKLSRVVRGDCSVVEAIRA